MPLLLFLRTAYQDPVEGEGDASILVASPSASAAAFVPLSAATSSTVSSAATNSSGESGVVVRKEDATCPLFWNHQFRGRDQRALASAVGWLTDASINILGGLFWRQAAQRAILEGEGALSKLWLSSFFFSQLCAGGRDQFSKKSQSFFNTAVHEHLTFHQRVKQVSPSVDPPPHGMCHHLFDDFAEVLIPIRHQGNHWLLAVYRASENTITIYDSLCKPHSSYLPIATAMGAFLEWQRENSSSSGYCGCRPSVDFVGPSRTHTIASPSSALRLQVDRTFPQQANSSDCGVYLLIAAQLLLNRRLQSRSAAADADAAAPTVPSISSTDLTADVARGARRLWTAYLTQPHLHLSPLLHAEIHTDAVSSSTSSSLATSPTPMDHPADVMLGEEESSQSSSAASTETCPPLPCFSSLKIRPLSHASAESLPSAIHEGDASMTDDAFARSQELDASRSTSFAAHEAVECLSTAHATAASLATTRSISDSSRCQGSVAAPTAVASGETLKAVGLVESRAPSPTTRAHSALLLGVLRGKHFLLFLLLAHAHGFQLCVKW
jgi:hypothetical protein